MIFAEQNGQSIGMARANPRNPDSEQQRTARSGLRPTLQAWRALTDDQREAWKTYARRWFGTCEPLPTSYDIFRRAAMSRVYQGLEPNLDPPVAGPAYAVSRITQRPAGFPTTLVFTVEHGFGDLHSMYVMTVKVSPPTRSPGAMPNPRSLQLVCGIGPGSTIPLPASGETVTFEDIYCKLPAGCRFGIEVVVSRKGEESFPGEPLLASWIRM